MKIFLCSFFQVVFYVTLNNGWYDIKSFVFFQLGKD